MPSPDYQWLSLVEEEDMESDAREIDFELGPRLSPHKSHSMPAPHGYKALLLSGSPRCVSLPTAPLAGDDLSTFISPEEEEDYELSRSIHISENPVDIGMSPELGLGYSASCQIRRSVRFMRRRSVLKLGLTSAALVGVGLVAAFSHSMTNWAQHEEAGFSHTDGLISLASAQGPTVPLYNWYKSSRQDNFAAVGDWPTSHGYSKGLGAESSDSGLVGYLYSTQKSGTVPLYNWYSSSKTDNFAAVGDWPISHGYSKSGGVDGSSSGLLGYIYSTQKPGTVPLYNWYSSNKSDNFATVGDWPTSHGYLKGLSADGTNSGLIGYILKEAATPAPTPSPAAASSATSTPGDVFFIEAVWTGDDPTASFYVSGEGDNVYLAGFSGIKQRFRTYNHDDQYIFESVEYPQHFLSYDADGNLKLKYYASMGAPSFKLERNTNSKLGYVQIVTNEQTKRGRYLTHSGDGGTRVAIWKEGGSHKAVWRIPTHPDIPESCLAGTTAANGLYKCDDGSTCGGELCCLKKHKIKIQCPPNLPILCNSVHCSAKYPEMSGRDRCCVAKVSDCAAKGGAARCLATVGNCGGFGCPSGMSLKANASTIPCALAQCSAYDTPICCKVDNVSDLSPVHSKHVFVDKTTSVERGGFIYPRIEARLHDGDQVQLQSSHHGTYLKVVEESPIDARGRFYLSSANGNCTFDAETVRCDGSGAALFEVKDFGAGVTLALDNGKYCTDRGSKVDCKATNASGWETWGLSPGTDGTFCLKSGNSGKFCRVRNQQGFSMRGSARLRAKVGNKYVYCRNTLAALVCDENLAAGSEEIVKVDTFWGDNHISIGVSNSDVPGDTEYCSLAEQNGVRCNRKARAGGGEAFVMEQDGDKLMLKAPKAPWVLEYSDDWEDKLNDHLGDQDETYAKDHFDITDKNGKSMFDYKSPPTRDAFPWTVKPKGTYCQIRTPSIVTLRGNVSLKAGNGKYCYDRGGGEPVTCSTTKLTEKAMPRENFGFEYADADDRVYIRGMSQGLFCRDTTSYGIACNSVNATAWSKFQIVPAGSKLSSSGGVTKHYFFALNSPRNGKFCAPELQPVTSMTGAGISLKSGSHYCTDTPKAVTCEATEAKAAQKFEIAASPPASSAISLTGGHSKKFCSDQPDGVICNSTPATKPTGWEVFAFEAAPGSDSEVVLKGSRLHKYCAIKDAAPHLAEGEKIRLVDLHGYHFKDSADGVKASKDMQTFFEIAQVPGHAGRVTIKSNSSGKFCSDQPLGMVCNKDKAGWWEMFDLADAGGGQVGIKGHRKGKYCSSVETPVVKMRGQIKLKMLNTNKLCRDTADWLNCEFSATGSYLIEDTSQPTQVSIKGYRDDSYCADKPDGIKCFGGGKGKPSGWQIFTLVDTEFGHYALKGNRLGKYCGIKKQTAQDMSGNHIDIVNAESGSSCRFDKRGILCDFNPSDSNPEGERLIPDRTRDEDGQPNATFFHTKDNNISCADVGYGIECRKSINSSGFKLTEIAEGKFTMTSLKSGMLCGPKAKTNADIRGGSVKFKSAITTMTCSDQQDFVKCQKSTRSQQWENFDFEELGNGYVAIKGGRNMSYCTDTEEGVSCNASTLANATAFRLHDKPNNKFSIQVKKTLKYCGIVGSEITSVRGRGISIRNNKTGKLCEYRGEQVGMDCSYSGTAGYTFQDIDGSGKVSMQAASGKYCSDKPHGVTCTAGHVSSWGSFTITDAKMGLFALKSGRNGKFCRAKTQTANMVEGKGITLTHVKKASFCADLEGRITCSAVTKDHIAQTKFEVTQLDLGASKVAIKGNRTGQYCADLPTGVTCNGATASSWAQFTLKAEDGGRAFSLKGGRLGKYCGLKPAPIKNLRGSAIAFRSKATGLFCKDRYNGVFCNYKTSDAWGKYFVAGTLPGSTITLKGGRARKYCKDYASGVLCTASKPQNWGKFQIVDAGDGYLAIKGPRAGKYCAPQDQSVMDFFGSGLSLKRVKTGKYCTDFWDKIQCETSTVWSTEKWTVSNNGWGTATLRGNRKNGYCEDYPTGVVCDKDHSNATWGAFTVVDAGGDKVKLKGGRSKGYCAMKPESLTKVRGKITLKNKFNGKVCSFNSGVVTCDGSSSGDSEITVAEHGHSIIFKSKATDKYCSDTTGGIKCQSQWAQGWEGFTLGEADGNYLVFKGGRGGKVCSLCNQSIAEMRGTVEITSVGTGNKCMDQADGISCLITDPPAELTKFKVVSGSGSQVGLIGPKNDYYCTDEPSGIRCQADKTDGWEAFTLVSISDTTFALRGNRLGKFCAVNGDRIICDQDAPEEASIFTQTGWTAHLQVKCDQTDVTDKALFEIDGWSPTDRLICDPKISAADAEVFEQGGWKPLKQLVCNGNDIEAAKFKPDNWDREDILMCDQPYSTRSVFEVGDAWKPAENLVCDGTTADSKEYKFAPVGWNEDSRIECNRLSDENADMHFEAKNWKPGTALVCDGNPKVDTATKKYQYSLKGWAPETPLVCDYDDPKDPHVQMVPVGWLRGNIISCDADLVAPFTVGGWTPDKRLVCDETLKSKAAIFKPEGWTPKARIMCNQDTITDKAKFEAIGAGQLLKKRIFCDVLKNDSYPFIEVDFDSELTKPQKRLICDSDKCDSAEARFKPEGWTSEKTVKQTSNAEEASTFAVIRKDLNSAEVKLLCLDVAPVRYLDEVGGKLYCNGTHNRGSEYSYHRPTYWNSGQGFLQSMKNNKFLHFTNGEKVLMSADSGVGGWEAITFHLTGGYETVRPLARGVNLGNWLLLERWMSQELFTNTTGGTYEDVCAAIDEYGLMNSLRKEDEDDAKTRMEAHWASWITEADIGWIADHGLNAVRIPFGYWIVKPEAPFVEGGFKYLVKAVEWCEAHKIGFMLDFHGLKGSQTGALTSGNCGACHEESCGETWLKFLEPENQAVNLEVIENVSKHFADSPMYLGFEVANEVAGSSNSSEYIAFCEKAYNIIRASHKTIPIYIYKTFRPSSYPWKNFDEVLTDDHTYFRNLFEKADPNPQVNLGKLKNRLLDSVNFAVVVGEWSLNENGFNESNFTSADARHLRYNRFAKMQLQAYETYSTGWYYWAYKTQYPGSTWNYIDMCKNGWVPGCKKEAQNFTQQPWWRTDPCAFAYLDGRCDKTEDLVPMIVRGDYSATHGWTPQGKKYVVNQAGATLHVGTETGTIAVDPATIQYLTHTGRVEGKLIRWSNGEYWIKTA